MKKPIVLHKVPLDICSLPGTTFADKIILQVVYTFREKGMVLFDGVIADYCLCSRQHIVNRISALNEMGYLRIEKPKSKYRRIFPSEKMLNLLTTIIVSRKESTDNPTCKRDNYSSQYSLRVSNSKTTTEEKACGDNKTLRTGRTEQNTFDRFWSVYPKRVDKKTALAAWGKLNSVDGLLEKIIIAAAAVATRAQAGGFEGPRGRLQYCKNPATWLNAGSFDDETPDEIEHINDEPRAKTPFELQLEAEKQHRLEQHHG